MTWPPWRWPGHGQGHAGRDVREDVWIVRHQQDRGILGRHPQRRLKMHKAMSRIGQPGHPEAVADRDRVVLQQPHAGVAQRAQPMAGPAARQS